MVCKYIYIYLNMVYTGDGFYLSIFIYKENQSYTVYDRSVDPNNVQRIG